MSERAALTTRLVLMAVLLLAGTWWLQPRDQTIAQVDVRFSERAESHGALNVHSRVQLADDFANIMPWLASVGAAAAAGDYDGDGDVDLYVTNSGRGDSNRLLRNRGDGHFEDVTQQAGVGCGNPSGASMHAVWGDVDNDGHLDLFVGKWAEPNQLFHNKGDGTFRDITQEAGVGSWGYANGATFLDYDRDGWLDLLIGNYFADQVEHPETGEWVRNDLWNPVTTRVMHETFTHADNGGRNVLFRNQADGTFRDVTEEVGLHFTGWTLAVGSGDLNNDGWPDLYLANDFGPDELYLNTGATEATPAFRVVVDPEGHPGIGNDWWKGMNVDMGDVDNDGYLDIYVTNILEERYKTDEGNMLWLNRSQAGFPGGRGFVNVATESGTFAGGWGWGGKFADFNNDGRLDIYTVNGFVTGSAERNYWFQIQEMVTQTKNQSADAADWPVMGDRDLSGRERGRLFVQLPPGAGEDDGVPRFVEAAEQAGITDRYNGRGIAIADYDGDGDLDLYVANQGAASCYYTNLLREPAEADTPAQEGAPHAFVRLQLRGQPQHPHLVAGRRFASTTQAIGARVTLTSESGLQVREVQGGMGFASQSETTVHFGVPHPEELKRITVRWPSGRTQVFEGDVLSRFVNQTSVLLEPGEETSHVTSAP